MKQIGCLLTLAAATAAAPLQPGDGMKTDVFATAEFLQGEAPKQWDRGALYLISCWATWSQQSVAEIPRLNQLFTELKPDGLRVIGVNVWDDDPAEVGRLLAEKGTGMAYPVAYVGMSGELIDQWLRPAGVKSLPHVFVVRDGELLFGCHPSLLTAATVAMLLEADAKADEFVKSQRAAAARVARVAALDARLSQLARANKHKEALDLVTKEMANAGGLTTEDLQRFTITKAMIQTALKQTAAALKTLEEAKALDPQSPMARDIDALKEKLGADASQP